MRTFVESLKRLYKAGRVTIAKLEGFLAERKISQEEYDYIVS